MAASTDTEHRDHHHDDHRHYHHYGRPVVPQQQQHHHYAAYKTAAVKKHRSPAGGKKKSTGNRRRRLTHVLAGIVLGLLVGYTFGGSYGRLRLYAGCGGTEGAGGRTTGALRPLQQHRRRSSTTTRTTGPRSDAPAGGGGGGGRPESLLFGRRDDGQPVPGHQGGRVTARGRGVPGRVMFYTSETSSRPPGRGRPAARPVADGGRLVPAAKKVVPDAAAHVGQLRQRVRVVHAGRRRRVRPSGPAGRAAPVGGQPETSVHRTGGPRQPRGIRSAESRVRRELLHGRARRDHEPRDPGPGGAAHQTLPEEPLHHARGRRAGPVRAKIRWRVVHVVLRGTIIIVYYIINYYWK
ncbi:hypothetical protein AGLY_001166 [Aphis glycines]|uniref:Uncharacterized protein n=1 Tax=Aphis glycines TaxID=307491 RepID=A0A6G0U9J6_APHGL|nr:hypothetical protein AGLY_001166 [Aphis glycines]